MRRVRGTVAGPEPRAGDASTRRLGVATVVVLAVLAACRPLYLPPVPEAPPPAEYTLLGATSSLAVVGGRPVLTLVVAALDAPPEGAWLDVQWFGPGNVQVASESVWVGGEDVGATIELPLPADVEVVPGEWRAVVSHAGAYVRQFRVDLAADPEP